MTFLQTIKLSALYCRFHCSFDLWFLESIFCRRLQVLHKILYGILNMGANKYTGGRKVYKLGFLSRS